MVPSDHAGKGSNALFVKTTLLLKEHFKQSLTRNWMFWDKPSDHDGGIQASPSRQPSHAFIVTKTEGHELKAGRCFAKVM